MGRGERTRTRRSLLFSRAYLPAASSQIIVVSQRRQFNLSIYRQTIRRRSAGLRVAKGEDFSSSCQLPTASRFDSRPPSSLAPTQVFGCSSVAPIQGACFKQMTVSVIEARLLCERGSQISVLTVSTQADLLLSTPPRLVCLTSPSYSPPLRLNSSLELQVGSIPMLRHGLRSGESPGERQGEGRRGVENRSPFVGGWRAHFFLSPFRGSKTLVVDTIPTASQTRS